MKESGTGPLFPEPGNPQENDSGKAESGRIISDTDPDLQKKVEELETRVALLQSALQDRTDEKDELAELVNEREDAISWKVCQLYGSLIPAGSPLTRNLSALLGRMVRVFRKNGPAAGEREGAQKRPWSEDLARILAENRNCRGIILIPPSLGWDIPLFQRPQQLSLVLADLGYLVFFSTPVANSNTVHGFQMIRERCYITDQYPLLTDELPPFYCLFPSTYIGSGSGEIRKLKDRCVLVYDYLDEISDKIVAFSHGKLRRNHEYRLRNADIVLTTAGSLYAKARETCRQDVYLVPNGVDYSHFHVRRDPRAIPSDLQPVLSRGNPVIGYYGALAVWFDYALVTNLARERPGYEIVLIGWDYDGSMKDRDLEKYQNIHLFDAKKYPLLPGYAVWFDVSIIPFVVDEITRSTSPIKLFEYMALGHPIVTSEMAECRKYRLVLSGTTDRDFIQNVDLALACRTNPAYLALLDEEARNNTWASRAAAIDAILTARDGNVRADPVPRGPGPDPAPAAGGGPESRGAGSGHGGPGTPAS